MLLCAMPTVLKGKGEKCCFLSVLDYLTKKKKIPTILSNEKQTALVVVVFHFFSPYLYSFLTGKKQLLVVSGGTFPRRGVQQKGGEPVVQTHRAAGNLLLS